MLALRYQNIKWIVIPVNKRISASLRCVSRLLYLFANRQRQASSATAAALASLPPVRGGIDQNVYTYARFSFNNSSNALSAHKKLWHSTFVFECVCKMCEASGRGGACANFDNAANTRASTCRSAPDHLCVASSDGISIIGKTACVCMCVFVGQSYTYACAYTCVCVCVCA